MKINPWGVESEIYAILSMSQATRSSRFEKTMNMGGCFNVDVKFIDFKGGAIGNHEPINPEEHKLALNFRSGNEYFFRVDNYRHGYLHYDLPSGGRVIKERIPEDITIAETVSLAFSIAQEVAEWRFPDLEIAESSGFTGSC